MDPEAPGPQALPDPPGPDPLAWLRRQFPVTARGVYLNHAAVSPLARPTVAAMHAHHADVLAFGSENWQLWDEALAGVRRTLAGLIGAASDEIALVKNTSEGLSAAAQGLDWRPGDRVLTFACEFPANLYPWLALRERGVVVEVLPEAALADLDRLRAALRGARLLALSFVQYGNGFRSDLNPIGALCREAGAWFVVDAIQGLGAFPLDVRAGAVDVLAADGHKWMTGPEGAGLLYVRRERQPELTPRQVGWLSLQPAADPSDYAYATRLAAAPGPLPWRAGARRYEPGTLNTAGFIGLGAAVRLLQTAGIPRLAERILTLTGYLADRLEPMGAAILRLDHPLADRPCHRSGILSFRLPGLASAVLVSALARVGVIATERNGYVRFAPHGYNTLDDLEAVLALLRTLRPAASPSSSLTT